jgi:thioredoxin-related protein
VFCDLGFSVEKYMNRLANETSPYLLQHRNNPVDWYPWGPEALERAKREDKPIFLSVGYSACHWCHVMEHESFEDERIARLMNEHFVNIKLDREERPDVDHERGTDDDRPGWVADERVSDARLAAVLWRDVFSAFAADGNAGS